RYLWTDAFAVCNYLELHHRTGNVAYLQNARDLVDQVHNELGRQRVDHPRAGWISGLSDSNGGRHPTRGGLRIGKKLDQRGPNEPVDERLEWERDGQYFHYLTKWMHALNRVTSVTGDPRYNLWALELAKVAHTGFAYKPISGGPKRMYWKMSIDLTYPLVASMGQHDPLDGLITYKQLQATAVEYNQTADAPGLDAEIADFEAMCEGRKWSTDDALGIGGLLADACRLSQLITAHDPGESRRLVGLLGDAEVSLDSFVAHLDYPVEYRLAFRELGLAIGIHAIDKMRDTTTRFPERSSVRNEFNTLLSRFRKFLPLSEHIECCWLEPVNQHSRNWVEHLDINSVMLATSLAPDGYLILG
ncbi:unnamed protein product, partial [marine sediment metagenome]